MRPGTPWRVAANLATLGNALCGAGAIAYVLLGNKLFALFLLLAGMAFDGLDGLLSRRSSRSGGALGRIADSVADGLTFCIAPAVALYFDNYPRSLWSPWQPVALLVALLLAAVGLTRLVRYTSSAWQEDHFVGASTPQNALVLMVLVPLFEYPAFVASSPPALLLGVLAAIPLMLLPVPYPKMRRGAPLRRLTAALSACVALSLVVLNFRPSPGSLPWYLAEGAAGASVVLLLAVYIAGPFAVNSRERGSGRQGERSRA